MMPMGAVAGAAVPAAQVKFVFSIISQVNKKLQFKMDYHPQQLPRICSHCGCDNATKNNIMIVGSRADRKSVFPNFVLSAVVLKECRRLNI